MVFLSVIFMLLPIGYACNMCVIMFSGLFSFIFAAAIVCWCSSSAANMFVAMLGMSNQKPLVAYPVGLLYAVFALISIF